MQQKENPADFQLVGLAASRKSVGTLHHTIIILIQDSQVIRLLAPLKRVTLFTLSNTRKASRISSSLSVSFIFLAIMVRNSGKSMVPLPGAGDQ